MTDEPNSISFDQGASEKRAESLPDDHAQDRVSPDSLAASVSGSQSEGQPAETIAASSEGLPSDEVRAPEQTEVDARAKALTRVLRRYRKVNDEFLLKDQHNTPAFKDKGDRLVTAHYDPEIARSMVDLARAKGWGCIKVSGSKAFKQEIWLYASAQGMVVAGYVPGELDQVKLVELRNDVSKRAVQAGRSGVSLEPAKTGTAIDRLHSHETRAPAPPPVQPGLVESGTSEAPPPLTARHQAALIAMETILRKPSEQYPGGHTEPQINAALAAARARWTNDRVYVGRLIDQGPANYDFKQDSPPSYYVRLEDPHGAKFVLWGVDLPRALEEAQHKPDDDLMVSFKGCQQVEVPRIVHLAGGKRKVEYDVVTRNLWDAIAIRTLAPQIARDALEQAKRSKGPDMDLVIRGLRNPSDRAPPDLSANTPCRPASRT